MITATVKEFEAMIPGMDYPMAANVIKFMILTGQAKNVGIREPEKGKGKGSVLYELEEKVTIDFHQVIRQRGMVQPRKIEADEESSIPTSDADDLWG